MQFYSEKAAISIARAPFRNAPILLLDEPTSALDAESEEVVAESVANMRGRCTCLVLAHRWPASAGADHVWNLADGELTKVR